MLAPARPQPDDVLPVAEGVDIAVWHHGTGGAATSAPFLLVHGLASNAHLWDDVADHLTAAGHPVATIDLRGHGRSAKPDGLYDLSTVASDVVALLPQLGWASPAVFAGQSYGALVVLEAAQHLGDAVAAIGCVDGGHLDLRSRWPDWDDCVRVLAPPRTAGMRAEALEAAICESHRDWPKAGVAATLACFELRADGTVAPWLTFERHIEVLRGLWAADVVGIREATAQRTLLLTADDGMPGKAADVERAAAQLTRSEVVWMRGHHDLHAQHPADVASALLHLARST